jgi:hypothetical protein
MQGDEIRALRRLQREQTAGPHVFASEQGGPMAPKSFHTLVARLGERAMMPFHPCMRFIASTGVTIAKRCAHGVDRNAGYEPSEKETGNANPDCKDARESLPRYEVAKTNRESGNEGEIDHPLAGRADVMRAVYSFAFNCDSFAAINARISAAISSSLSHCSL